MTKIDTIAGALQRARLDKGLSLRAAAAELGVSHTAFFRWEEGRDQLTEDRIPAVAKFLGVNVGEVRRLWEQENVTQQKGRVARTPAARIKRLEDEVDALREMVEQQTRLIEQALDSLAGSRELKRPRRSSN